MFVLAILVSFIFIQTSCGTCLANDTCCNKFELEYNLLLKVVQLEEKTKQQDIKITALNEELIDAKNTIAELNETVTSSNNLKGNSYSDSTTYVRWGRTVCPSTAIPVYDGFAAGSSHTHGGTASNILCLPKNPDYDHHQDGFQASGRIYGAEYETRTHNKWTYLDNHEVPCVVCQIPRSNVLMVPGKNTCHENYILEYKGYLMSENYAHTSSEFVCVDYKPEVLAGGDGDQNGKLFHFVEGVCGSLKCDPYKNGWELTCAVCSFRPSNQSSNLQPYN